MLIHESIKHRRSHAKSKENPALQIAERSKKREVEDILRRVFSIAKEESQYDAPKSLKLLKKIMQQRMGN